MLTTKHHDHPLVSSVLNPYRPHQHETQLNRDIVGELETQSDLSTASTTPLALTGAFDTLNGTCKACKYRQVKEFPLGYETCHRLHCAILTSQLLDHGSRKTQRLLDYAVAHLYGMETKPCILWNDINFPDFHKAERLHEIFAHFYSKVCPGHGIINDRWKLDEFNGDFKTPEYRTLDEVDSTQPWESNRGIGYSFGFNRNEGEKETMTSKWYFSLISPPRVAIYCLTLAQCTMAR